MTRKTNTKGRAAEEEAKTSAAAEKPEQEPAPQPATAEAAETVSATHSEGQAGDQGAQTSASAEGATQAPEADAASASPGEGAAVQDDEPSGLEVVVVGPKRGRWRAGRHFGAEPVSIPLEELSEDDKAALLADPVLIVSVAEVSRRP